MVHWSLSLCRLYKARWGNSCRQMSRWSQSRRSSFALPQTCERKSIPASPSLPGQARFRGIGKVTDIQDPNSFVMLSDFSLFNVSDAGKSQA